MPRLQEDHRNLLLYENYDDSSAYHIDEDRRGVKLSHGVAQMFQLWPQFLHNVLWTFFGIIILIFVFILAILFLFLTKSFNSDDQDLILNIHARSIGESDRYGSQPVPSSSTDKIYKYIINNEEKVNFFYVINEYETINDNIESVLNFYARSNFNVFIVKVCYTKFYDDTPSETSKPKEQGKKSNLYEKHRNMPLLNENNRNVPDENDESNFSKELLEKVKRILDNRNSNQSLNSISIKKNGHRPTLSTELDTEMSDSLKKVQLCMCKKCNSDKYGQIKQELKENNVLKNVEVFNVNYFDLLRHSIFSNLTSDNRKKSIDRLGTDNGLIKKNNFHDLNLVKLILLWKFGNSLVLIGNEKVLFSSELINRGKVNLGFNLIYSPYECSSVVYSLMVNYLKNGNNLKRAILDVYKLYCRNRFAFCSYIAYVQL